MMMVTEMQVMTAFQLQLQLRYFFASYWLDQIWISPSAVVYAVVVVVVDDDVIVAAVVALGG